MKLSRSIIESLASKEGAYKISDGRGLYLHIMPNGSKYWRLKYRFWGKEKILALGVYPDLSLKDARDKIERARQQLAQNIDPSEVKKENKHEKISKSAYTFALGTSEWYSKNAPLWKESHRKRILRRVEADLLPKLGKLPIDKITAPELLRALRVVEERSIPTSHRLLQICSSIFGYAIVTGRLDFDITLSLKGALGKVKKKNYAYLPEEGLADFMIRLSSYEEKIIRLALQLLIHTLVRSTELREAKWDEINWDKKEWRIPAERMKMGNTHIIPLSLQMLGILKELQVISGNMEYIFPAEKAPLPIGKNTLLNAIYDMGYKGKTTIHGFRATASTILNENGFPADVIERQLAHTEGNKVRASYNHAQHLPERRKMLQWWGDFIDQQSGNNVIQMKRASNEN